jgi:hypothetical protein
MTWSEKNIIFIISLPRSGSTLLQRILASDPRISSASESWHLLPQFYALKEGSVFAEYGHTPASRAIQDFSSSLPNGKNDYLDILKQSTIALFQSASSDDSDFFIEKSPRNTLIVDDLLALFKNSKFIFLWRNPLASAASLIETFGKGKWKLYKHYVDLYTGFNNMISASSSEDNFIYNLKYEDLLESPVDSCKRLYDFLELEFDISVLSSFKNKNFTVRMGDPTGSMLYDSISKEPLEKWKKTLSNPIRKSWAIKYIKWIGKSRLSGVGYDFDELMAGLVNIPISTHKLGSDLIHMPYGWLDRHLQISAIHSLSTKKRSDSPIYRLF